MSRPALLYLLNLAAFGSPLRTRPTEYFLKANPSNIDRYRVLGRVDLLKKPVEIESFQWFGRFGEFNRISVSWLAFN